ncbi:hypothetical protein CAI21_03425 [Alkalilimnicola ehrlichii]|uniref:Cation transporter n=1 Tax=Alkalilimnicola ehrlichii TaxID=351052 RepID=A0A3E0X3T9_9GAMM|nr:Na+/H+ antiporter subunit E [Alkalilimnicola ehrlichii]RFA31034.1 hypothetical protein CAI21_03425 [Alkalilimnicola ehrlichii]RFA38987.1 hypothetical protein CAL65_03575 [Alkalilimnicola ehrlichii]
MRELAKVLRRSRRRYPIAWSSWLRSALLRSCSMAFVWFAFTGWQLSALRYGVPIVVGVAALSLWMLPPRPRQSVYWRVIVLVPILFWYSLVGGFDVAQRAFRPSMPIRPDFIQVRLRSPKGAAAIVLAYVVTLLPGTLVATVRVRSFELHVIDTEMANVAMLRRVEALLRWALEAKRKR